jgi:hypothetical protein
MKLIVLILLSLLALGCQNEIDLKRKIVQDFHKYELKIDIYEKDKYTVLRYELPEPYYHVKGSIVIRKTKERVTVSQMITSCNLPLIEADSDLNKDHDIISFRILNWGNNSMVNPHKDYVIVNSFNTNTNKHYIEYFEDHDTHEPVIILKQTPYGVLVPLTREQQLKERD